MAKCFFSNGLATSKKVSVTIYGAVNEGILVDGVESGYTDSEGTCVVQVNEGSHTYKGAVSGYEVTSADSEVYVRNNF